jgi:hypothetical protein
MGPDAPAGAEGYENVFYAKQASAPVAVAPPELVLQPGNHPPADQVSCGTPMPAGQFMHVAVGALIDVGGERS